jgi:hypothetical protein
MLGLPRHSGYIGYAPGIARHEMAAPPTIRLNPIDRNSREEICA